MMRVQFFSSITYSLWIHFNFGKCSYFGKILQNIPVIFNSTVYLYHNKCVLIYCLAPCQTSSRPTGHFYFFFFMVKDFFKVFFMKQIAQYQIIGLYICSLLSLRSWLWFFEQFQNYIWPSDGRARVYIQHQFNSRPEGFS